MRQNNKIETLAIEDKLLECEIILETRRKRF